MDVNTNVPKKHDFKYFIGQGLGGAMIAIAIQYIANMFVLVFLRGHDFLQNIVMAIILIIVTMLWFKRLGKGYTQSIVWMVIFYIILLAIFIVSSGAVGFYLIVNKLVWAGIPIVIGALIGMKLKK